MASTVLASGRLETAAATSRRPGRGPPRPRRARIRGLGSAARIVAVSVVDRWTDRLERAAQDVGTAAHVVAAQPRSRMATALAAPGPAPGRTDSWPPGRRRAPARQRRSSSSTWARPRPSTPSTAMASSSAAPSCPASALAADALAEGTAALPRVDLELPDERRRGGHRRRPPERHRHRSPRRRARARGRMRARLRGAARRRAAAQRGDVRGGRDRRRHRDAAVTPRRPGRRRRGCEPPGRPCRPSRTRSTRELVLRGTRPPRRAPRARHRAPVVSDARTSPRRQSRTAAARRAPHPARRDRLDRGLQGRRAGALAGRPLAPRSRS